MRRIATQFGNPESSFKSIHVAGSKGKGSCAAMISAGLVDCGKRTGLYTSPHVSDLEERIAVNGRNIPPRRLAALIDKIRPIFEHVDKPTFFEAMTLCAFLYFQEEEVEWAVIEAGIGGRYSSTNIIEPECAVITSISMEHSDVIGDSIKLIALEKSGVARPGIPVITSVAKGDSLTVIQKECERTGAKLLHVTAPVEHDLALIGEHQKWNAACALAAVSVLQIPGCDEAAIMQAMARVTIPGRFELACVDPQFILDGAHTPESALLLADSMKQKYAGQSFVLVFTASSSKGVRAMLECLLPGASAVVFTKYDYPGFLSPETMKEIASDILPGEVVTAGSPEHAVEKARRIAHNSPVLVTGSFYLVGDIRSLLNI